MPKFPPPPRSAQNRSRVRVLAGGHECAVGEDHVGGEQVVHGQAETAGQVADAAAQGQARPRRWRRGSRTGGHAERHRRVVDITPGASGVSADGVVPGADRGAAQQRQVDDQRAVGYPQPSRVVAAAPDGDLGAVVAGEPHAGDDVGGVPAAGNRGRMLVDHGVVDGARLRRIRDLPGGSRHRAGRRPARRTERCRGGDVAVMRAPLRVRCLVSRHLKVGPGPFA